MRKRRTTSPDLKNLKMNKDTYKLRREAMSYIYEMKKLFPGLPRIDVRITEDHKKILGQGRMKGKVIWITKKAVTKRNLRPIVYHEVLHAVKGVGHKKDCPLMSPVIKPISKTQCQSLFTKYMK